MRSLATLLVMPSQKDVRLVRYDFSLCEFMLTISDTILFLQMLRDNLQSTSWVLLLFLSRSMECLSTGPQAPRFFSTTFQKGWKVS